MVEALGNLLNVLLMILGFSLVIFVHEMGHFLAARWAGVRAPAFALGFGSAICSWRKGLGFRWGSTETEYARLLARSGQSPATGRLEGISPTEYRINWFPFGGYVRMLGQDDSDPSHRSDHPESYNSKPVWKRMVIISAGVAMNLVLSAGLFVAVFVAGMPRAAPIVGQMEPESAEWKAGIRPGDVIVSVNGEAVRTFDDQAVAVAMARKDKAVTFELSRAGDDGAEQRISASLTPEEGAGGLRGVGLDLAPAAKVVEVAPDKSEEQEIFDRLMRAARLEGLRPGSTLVRVDGAALGATRITAPSKEGSVTTGLALFERAAKSEGEPFEAVFRDAGGAEYAVTMTPRPKMDQSEAKVGESKFLVEHVLGMLPVLKVSSVQEAGERAGLRDGDVFVRIGSVAWPGEVAGITEIQRHKGRAVAVTVRRDGELVELSCEVDGDGRIGFEAATTASESGLVAAGTFDEAARAGGAIEHRVLGGSRLTRVNGEAVRSLEDAQRVLLRSIADEAARGEGATVRVELALPETLGSDGAVNDGASAAADLEPLDIALSADEVKRIHGLGWTLPGAAGLFENAMFTMQASSPAEAVGMGVHATRRVLLLTYLTFVRLFDGSVSAKQLKGPVGITHIGSRYAEEGLIQLMFFLALVSANLAVVNFLPIPITDGGHLIFLMIEGVTRRPVSLAVQNAATLVGLVLIGAMFLFVTFNDVKGLLG